MKAKNDYQAEFQVHANAGAGVILTRAREPFRVIAALRDLALQQAGEFRQWNIIGGWHTFDAAKPDAPPARDKLRNPQQALMKVGDLDGDGTNAWPDGIYVMDGLHPFLGGGSDKPDPILVAVLRNYAYSFPTSLRRLVIVVPETFILPDELQHDIPVVDYELPDKGELETVLCEIIESSFPDNQTPHEIYDHGQREQLVASATGMTRLEAESAFSQAVVRNMTHFPAIPFDTFNAVILDTKTTVVKRSEVLELMKPGKIEDVGGLDQLKQWIAMRKCCFTAEAMAFGVSKPLGIALIGPPGTGKSVSAKLIAAVLAQPLIRMDVGRLFGSLVGQTEGRVRSALKQLEAMAPCVAFIDEVDKAGLDPRQGGGDSGTSKRVMGSILTFMQESTAPIFWLFTANRVDGLPPELLRKGRLDECFAVLPPNATERREVLNIHLRARKQDPAAVTDLEDAVLASDGYVSAEIEAAVKEAVIDAYHNDCPVTGELIAQQLRNMTPLAIAFPDDFRAMREWAENNARLASTPETPMTGKQMLSTGSAIGSRPRRRRIG
jgi:AAA+ superfamily predicted ATPase